MQIDIQTFTVHKRFPLKISRGTTAQTTNILVKIQHENIEGWGEASPFSTGEKTQPTTIIQQALQQITPALEKFSPLDRQQIEQLLTESQIPSAARAAIDIALHDWVGKKVGLPLWRLWGLERHRIVPISVTIGISTPEVAQQRVRNWLEFIDVRVLKLKLGSSEGVEADQAMLMAVKEAAPPDTLLYVDANGGWSLEDGVKMCDWLATVGVVYVEQPLAAVSAMTDLPHLYERSPLPIFVDESCFTAQDIPPLADRVHGINIKLMKSGGLTEAMRMVYVAKACGLQVMFGCYSDSCLANTAAAQLAPFADYLDLDSHLNLIDDPFTGAVMEKGRLLPNDLPGLGVK
ncbi:dipeptide epimerase [Okeania sp.]|uniref:dipeptide epimerase n=1 Tax=Okeania sp. TaxID=3100323 RepID=UPI002B4B0469|nr:dipeptide epimerase [Okeania sp.]MEB3342243.1 dipeptide epimerase [Okeania sp.]